jgi:hypothetical protein
LAPVRHLALLLVLVAAAVLAAPASALDLHSNVLVSRANGPAGAKGDRPSTFPELSADGRYVAFTTEAIDPADPVSAVGGNDVYVRDLVTGTTVLASRANGANGAANAAPALALSISSDGRKVAFMSSGSLDPSVATTGQQVFVRDLDAETTRLASGPNGAGATAPNGAADGWISGNGRYVCVQSSATNLVSGGPGGEAIYRRDLVTNTTILVSRGTGANGTPVIAKGCQLSDDGSRVTFTLPIAVGPKG